jgi:ribosomal protein S27AE
MFGEMTNSLEKLRYAFMTVDELCGTRRELKCPRCGDKMRSKRTVLMDLEVSAFMCLSCGEVVYDFSGDGATCGSCPQNGACLLV